MKEKLGTKLSSYKLPVKTPERNFPQSKKTVVYSLQDLTSGDYAGMTESDGKSTNGADHGAYTKIQEGYGKAGSISGGTKQGFDVKMDKNARVG